MSYDNSDKDFIEEEGVSTKLVTVNNQEVLTQMKFNVSDSDSIISENFQNQLSKPYKTTTKYVKKVIRKVGPDGEVTEEVIEEGTKPEGGILTQISKSNSENNSKLKMCGDSKIQTHCGFQIINNYGDEISEDYTTKPIEVSLNNENVNNSFPLGATVKKISKDHKSHSIIHSSNLNGEEQVIFSKSGYQTVTSESNFTIKSTDDKDQIPANENGKDVPVIDNSKTDTDTNHCEDPQAILNSSEDQQIVPKRSENQQTSPNNSEVIPSDCDHERIKEEEKPTPNPRIVELSKILDFGKNSPKDILTMELVKEGQVKALEALQKFPTRLKKIRQKHQIIFTLIVLNDLVILAIRESNDKLNVIENWEKNQVKATIFDNSNRQNKIVSKPNSVKKKQSILSCVQTKRPLPENIPENSFVLSGTNGEKNSSKDQFVLSVSSIESRNEWIKVLEKN